jgi:hypothetical protein
MTSLLVHSFVSGVPVQYQLLRWLLVWCIWMSVSVSASGLATRCFEWGLLLNETAASISSTTSWILLSCVISREVTTKTLRVVSAFYHYGQRRRNHFKYILLSNHLVSFIISFHVPCYMLNNAFISFGLCVLVVWNHFLLLERTYLNGLSKSQTFCYFLRPSYTAYFPAHLWYLYLLVCLWRRSL